MQADLGDLHVVDGDLARRRLQQPEEAQRHGRLARSGATNNPDLGGKHSVIGGIGNSSCQVAPCRPVPHLLSSFDTQRELFEDQVQSLSVADAVVVELHVALRGPFGRRLLVLHLPGRLRAESAALGKLFLNNSLAQLFFFFFTAELICSSLGQALKS